MKHLIALGSAAFFAMTGLAPHARAATIDTFDFSNLSDWSLLLGSSVPDTGFLGQFTGTVEPDGLIEMADLSAFSLTGSFGGFVTIIAAKADLAFFSYNTTGGASSLGFIAQPTLSQTACSGAPAVLDPICSFGGAVPATTRAVMFPVLTDHIAITPDQTNITLVSSVSTPEAPTWAMMLAGFAGLGFLGAGRARKGGRASVARPREGPAPPLAFAAALAPPRSMRCDLLVRREQPKRSLALRTSSRASSGF